MGCRLWGRTESDTTEATVVVIVVVVVVKSMLISLNVMYILQDVYVYIHSAANVPFRAAVCHA